MEGTQYSDTIDAGTGSDTLAGGEGDDVYVWRHGDGDDVILDLSERSSDGAPLDETRLDAINRLDLVGVAREQVSFELIPEGLMIVVAESAEGAGDGGRILAFGMYNGQDGTYLDYKAPGVDAIVFDDGTVLSAGAIMSEMINARTTDGDDYIVGDGYAETIIGGAGDDVIDGARGDDTFIWRHGDGNDHISDDSGYYSDTDVLKLVGVDPSQVSMKYGFERDIEMTIAESAPGAGDGARMTLDGAGGTGPRGIEEIHFDDGTIWERSDFQAVVVAGQQATEDDDKLIGTDQADTIEGLGGDDELAGDLGADLYRFSRGDGRDVIIDDEGDANTIEIIGYAPEEINFDRRGVNGPDLIIRLAGGDEITVTNALKDGVDALARVVLADDGTNSALPKSRRALWPGRQLRAMTQSSAPIWPMTFPAGWAATLSSVGKAMTLTALPRATAMTYRRRGQRYRRCNLSRRAQCLLSRLRMRAGPNSEDLALVFTEGRDRILLEGALQPEVANISYYGTVGVDRVVFADGTEWDRAEMRKQALEYAQTTGSEHVWGFLGDDTFEGSTGNDTVVGDRGSDTYIMARGHGHDVFEDTDTYWAESVDRIEFPDFVSSEVSVARLFKGSDSIKLTFASSPDDSLVVVDALAGSGAGIEEYHFSDGQTWTPEILSELLGNNAPVATDDGYYTVTEGNQLVLTPETLLRNDYDAMATRSRSSRWTVERMALPRSTATATWSLRPRPGSMVRRSSAIRSRTAATGRQSQCRPAGASARRSIGRRWFRG